MRIDNLHLILIGVIVILSVYIIYTHYTRDAYTPDQPQLTPYAPASVENKHQRTLVLFHGDWCGLCKKMMPSWQQAVKLLQEKSRGSVRAVAYESKDPSVKGYDIKGYPTIRLYDGDPVSTKPFVEYRGDRTAESLVNFALSTEKPT